MSRNDFDNLLPCEYHECLKAWDNERESDIKLQYEMQRFNSWLAAQVPGKSQIDLFRFPWEKQTTGKIKAWRGQPNTRN